VDAYEHVAPVTELDQEWANTVDTFEQTEGGAISEAEQERLWQAFQNGEDEVELLDLDNRKQRNEYATSLSRCDLRAAGGPRGCRAAVNRRERRGAEGVAGRPSGRSRG
jgi:hypothetical protein